MVQKGRSKRPSAKLSVDAVAVIRSSNQSAESLGRKFGVTASTVRFARRMQTWRNVEVSR